MDERMDKQMNKNPPVFYRISSPLGPLPCLLSLQFTIMQSRAMGIADHILPLGDLFDLIYSLKRSRNFSCVVPGVIKMIKILNLPMSGFWELGDLI